MVEEEGLPVGRLIMEEARADGCSMPSPSSFSGSDSSSIPSRV